MKEIHKQPKAVQDTLNSVIKNGKIDLSSVEITEDDIKKIEQIYIVACGSAWHVGMAAQYVLEDMADIPVRVELASEFRYRKMPVKLYQPKKLLNGYFCLSGAVFSLELKRIVIEVFHDRVFILIGVWGSV